MDREANRVYNAILLSSADFRTTGSLASELDMPVVRVCEALSHLETTGLVRRPVVCGSAYDEWFRDVRRGLTRAEKRARWLALITFTPMRDGF